jgi:hypothetical protein
MFLDMLVCSYICDVFGHVFSINQELDAQVASCMDGLSKGVCFDVLSTWN